MQIHALPEIVVLHIAQGVIGRAVRRIALGRGLRQQIVFQPTQRATSRHRGQRFLGHGGIALATQTGLILQQFLDPAVAAEQGIVGFAFHDQRFQLGGLRLGLGHGTDNQDQQQAR